MFPQRREGTSTLNIKMVIYHFEAYTLRPPEDVLRLYLGHPLWPKPPPAPFVELKTACSTVAAFGHSGQFRDNQRPIQLNSSNWLILTLTLTLT